MKGGIVLMQGKADLAKELFEKGYNCGQSVFLAFCYEMDMDFDAAARLSSSFGGGMGRLREVCGAVTAMFMIVGLQYGYTSPEDDEGKSAHYQLIQSLAYEFKNRFGSYICRDLLGLESAQSPIPEKRTAEYYQNRPCVHFVGYAAERLDELLKTKRD